MPRRAQACSSSRCPCQRWVQGTRSAPSSTSNAGRWSSAMALSRRVRITHGSSSMGTASMTSSGSGLLMKARSKRPLRRPSAPAESSTALRTTSTPGYSSRKDRGASDMISAAAVWETPTRTRTLSPRSASSASAAIASTSPRARRARRQTASPPGGRRTGPRGRAPAPLARGGQAYRPAAAGPVEQRPAQRRLKRRDLMRQRRLGVAELGRGPPERAQVRHREDGAQLAEANAAFNRIYRSYMAHFFSLVAVFFTLKCDGRASSGTAVVEEGSVSEEQGPVRLFRFLIYGLVLASSATQYSVVPILPVYAHRLGLTGVQQGMVLGAPGLATLAVSVPAGALSDRFGARRLTLWAGWLMSAAMFAQAMAGSFLFLLVARLGGGVGFCPLLARR